jgi:hypothetical protein
VTPEVDIGEITLTNRAMRIAGRKRRATAAIVAARLRRSPRAHQRLESETIRVSVATDNAA